MCRDWEVIIIGTEHFRDKETVGLGLIIQPEGEFATRIGTLDVTDPENAFSKETKLYKLK